MNGRAWLAVIAAALICGAAGYYFGVSDPFTEPFAAPGTVAGSIFATTKCLEEKEVVYESSTNPPSLKIAAPKDLEAEFPESSPGRSAVCWRLSISDADYALFDSIRVTQTRNIFGQGDQPILVGSGYFGNDRRVVLRFFAEPRWNGGDEHRIGYEVVGRLAASGDEIEADPEIVIKKPRI